MRYVVSGGTSAAATVGVLYLLVNWFHLWYLIAATVAFVVGVMLSFVLQKFWTFGEYSRDVIHRQLGKHVVFSTTNVFVNAFLMYFFVDIAGLHYLVAQGGAIALIAIYGFFVYQHVIFRL